MPAVRIALDAMGGDHAPGACVSGAVQAAQQGIAVALVGRADAIREELARHGAVDALPISVVDAPDVIAMDEAPLAALRRKPRASVRVAVDLVASGDADACYSVGHTGAAVIAAHAAFGLLPGVDRPALAVIVPTDSGAAVLLDAGASVECRPEHLVQFAQMGTAYAREALHVDEPRVGLLSIGEEAGKGNELIRDAHARLREVPLHFIGNVDARDLFTGGADVVVCDGFTGNVALKVGEGLVEAVERMLRKEFGAEFVSQIGALLTTRAFARFRQRVDYAEYGGAPLLGVSRLAIVGHGRSSPHAIARGIEMAARLSSARMVERLSEALARA